MKNIRLLIFSAAATLLFFTSCEKDNNVETKSADFEALSLGTEGFWNGSDGNGSFQSENFQFTNIYDQDWSTWSGFAYSQKNDVQTEGWSNQYSVYDASNGNNKFAVFFPPFGSEAFASFSEDAEYQVKSISLCNSSYVALSMKNGDAYAKKFGGATGNDPDWLKVTITGYDAAGTSTGTVDFYLADYRNADNFKDYIVNKWTEVDLSSLGKINKIKLSLSSSDNGDWGMNTPAYVCIDNIKYEYLQEEL